jgi:hypothetical protein
LYAKNSHHDISSVVVILRQNINWAGLKSV